MNRVDRVVLFIIFFVVVANVVFPPINLKGRLEPMGPEDNNGGENWRRLADGENWWNNDWGYRKLITIDHTKVDATLTNFPILVYNSSDSDLSSHAQADGDDIAFVLYSDNSTQLNHEIELYSSGTLNTWVNITSLSSTEDTKVWMYYGNDICSSQENMTDVWDSKYLAVHHMNETGGQHQDSTSNNNDSTTVSVTTQGSATGAVAGCDAFDGSDDYIQFPNQAFASGKSEIMVEMFINPDEWTDANTIYDEWHSTANWQFSIREDKFYTRDESGGTGESRDNDLSWVSSPSTGNWHHIVFWYSVSDGNKKLYLDGQEDASDSTNIGQLTIDRNADSPRIGYACDGDNYDGYVDEFRVSSTARNSSWINATYNTIMDDNFISFGGEESLYWVNSVPTFSNPNPANESIGISTQPTVNVTLSDADGNESTCDFYTSTDGESWIHQQTNSSVLNKSISYVYSGATGSGVTYYWKVTANDTNDNVSAVYHFTTESEGNWWNSNWEYRKLIQIDSDFIDSSLSNFPILVTRSSDTDLNNHALSNGDDVCFIDYSDNATQLKHEIEYYDSGTLHAWVNITSVNSTSDTRFWMYYGNDEASNQESVEDVWHGDIHLAVHFNETSTGTILDSTSLNNNGTTANTPDLNVNGKIGSGAYFDGEGMGDVADYIDFGSDSSITHTNRDEFAIEAWVNYDVMEVDSIWVCDWNGDDSWRIVHGTYDLEYENDDVKFIHRVNGDDTRYYGANHSALADTWYHYVLCYDANNNFKGVYVNGILENSTSDTVDTMHNDAGNFRLGSPPDVIGDTEFAFNGWLDEVRYYNTNQSACWIKASYHTQNSSTGFLTFGEEAEHEGLDSPVNSNPCPPNDATSVDIDIAQLNITVSDPNGNQMNITWRTNASGSWKDADTNSSVSNGTYYCLNTTWVDEYNTKYWWNVSTEDGHGGWDNDTFYFTTEEEEFDMPAVITNETTDITNTSATIHGYLSDDGGENCTTWVEWDNANLSHNECQGWIATGDVCVDGRSILEKNRHKGDEPSQKVYYFEGTNYSYWNVGSSGQCRMGMNEKGLCICNYDVSGTISEEKGEYATDKSMDEDESMHHVLGNYSTVSESAVALATHSNYDCQYGLISSEPGVGAIVAIDVSNSRANITWINNTWAPADNAYYCMGERDDPAQAIGEYMMSRIDAGYGLDSNDPYNISVRDLIYLDKTVNTSEGEAWESEPVFGLHTGTYGKYEGGIQNSGAHSAAVFLSGNDSFDGALNLGWVELGLPHVGVFLPLGASYVDAEDDILSNLTVDTGIDTLTDTREDYAEATSTTMDRGRMHEVWNYTRSIENMTIDEYEHLMDTIMTCANNTEAQERMRDYCNSTALKALQAYGSNTSWFSTNSTEQSDNSTGDEFYEELTGLTPGTVYYYRAWANNSAGKDSGDILTFMTKPDKPYAVSNTSYGIDYINLSWHKGSGGHYTIIEWNTSETWNRGGGNEIYNGTSNYYNHTSLDSGTTYYYQLWSYTSAEGEQQNSSDYADYNTITKGTSGTTWWNVSWINRKLITINASSVEGDLTNFPALIKFSSDTDLASDALDTGNDIAFILYSDNTTQLNHEVEKFDGDTGELISWVNVTSLSSSSDTLLWMYYGNPGAGDQQNINDTWDSNYKAVHHFKEGVDGVAQDSTQYNSDATPGHGDAPGSTDPDQTADGKLGYGVDFDGLCGSGTYGAYMDIADSPELSITGDLTVFCWMNYHGHTGSYDYWTGTSYNGGEWTFYLDSADVMKLSRSGAGWTSNQDITSMKNSWIQVAGVAQSGTGIWFHVDKTKSSVGSYQAGTNTAYARRLGGRANSPDARSWDGVMDEVRISDIARSWEWLNTSYNAISGPGAFCFRGEEEIFGNAPPELSDPEPSDGGTNIGISTSQLNITITDAEERLINYTIETSPNIGSLDNSSTGNNPGGESCGTKTCEISGLEYDATYRWYVNATDGDKWENATYEFSTEAEPRGWIFYRKITVNHSMVDENLTDFPILVYMNADSNLSAQAQSDGDDIQFWTLDNTTKYNHEIESYSEGTLYAWVNLTTVREDIDTEFWMKYGNNTCGSQQDQHGTWNNQYVLVYHMNGSELADTTDSTNYGHDAKTEWNNPGYESAGKIGNAVSFGGSEAIEASNDDSQLNLTNMTLECWVNTDHNNGGYFMSRSLNNVRGWAFGTVGTVDLYYMYGSQSSHSEINFITADFANTWQHVAVTVDDTTAKYYEDGILDPTGGTRTLSGSITSRDGHKILIGARTQTTDTIGWPLDGIVDEVRMSKVPRSHAWINATFDTANTPEDFIEVGSPKTGEAEPPTQEPPTQQNETPAHTSTEIDIMQATVNVTILDAESDPMNWTIEGPYVDDNSSNNSPDGSIEANLSTPLPFSTLIYWYVNVTDGTSWTNASYNFGTRAQYVPDGTTGLTANAVSPNQINLSWTKSDKCDYTHIRYKEIGYPVNRSDGSLACNITGAAQNVTGLEPSTTYYFRAWEYNVTDNVWCVSTGNQSETTMADVSVAITPATYSFGFMDMLAELETSGGYFNITNEGNVAINIYIEGTNATNATYGDEWELNTTVGEDMYRLQYSKDGGSTWYNITLDAGTNPEAEIVSALPPQGGGQHWQLIDIKVITPTITSAFWTMGFTLGLSAVES